MEAGMIIEAVIAGIFGVVLCCIGLYLLVSKKIIAANLFGQSNIKQDKTKEYAVGIGYGFIAIGIGFIITLFFAIFSGTHYGWICVVPSTLIGCAQMWCVRKKYNSKIMPPLNHENNYQD